MTDLKENKLLKIYLILLSLLNLVYIGFVGAKYNYADKHSLGSTIEMHHYEYLSGISRITNSIETIVLIIFTVYLVKVIMKKDKLSLIQFSIVHFFFFLFIILINYLVSVISPTEFWPSIQILFGPIQINTFLIIYLGITALYKKIFKNSKIINP